MTGCKTSNDARLTAMSVHNLGTGATEVTAKPQVGQSIHQRVNRPNKTRLQTQKSGHRPGDGFEGAFRSTGEARNEFYFPIRDSPQAKNRAQRVLLRPADNQPSDDMTHTHGLNRSMASVPNGAGGPWD